MTEKEKIYLLRATILRLHIYVGFDVKGRFVTDISDICQDLCESG
jgi:hypothetical protein